MTQEYKSIREWIAKGVNPVGYVDEDGRTVQRVALSDDGDFAWVGSIPMVSLDYLVAPPAPKRLSDEELLDEYVRARRNAGSSSKAVPDYAAKRDQLRSQILARMKAKGPTIPEVSVALTKLFKKIGVSQAYRSDMDHFADFLSMFPEGEE